MNGNEWGPGGPGASHGLRDAFDGEVDGLSIGPSPLGAVLEGGAALRRRRRAVWTGSVAGLLVLPVSAVVVFGGGAGSGGTAVSAASTGTATSTASPSSVASKAALPDPGTQAGQNGAVVLLPGHAPDPADQITVLGSGTLNGHAWRLVRDRLVLRKSDVPLRGIGVGPHLPWSQASDPQNSVCEATGFQFGDRPAGTIGDFSAVETCGPSASVLTLKQGEKANFGSLPVGAGYPADGSVAGVSGVARVDPAKVAKVVVTIGSVTVTPPIFRAGDEPMAYWTVVTPIDGLAQAKSFPAVEYTYYDAKGKVVDTGKVAWPEGMPPGPQSPPAPTK